ncbi:septal ring lytic transglycosylase RlpA family protein [Sandaracinus amylolyticus]|uniref:Probable endolytic peptidoglycan transglycosylase RlpA n=1 Tax=Sandaracinus amylolyticus TaxID=927083 RepID=A0A0F6W447_9BACT|nr:septal ring lytic transglycosylase RlpA family protein [Sandaracinus amylolyticus]AKF06802.1 Rare lipoprotein A precursor [Sandaracinus amylolyticus]
MRGALVIAALMLAACGAQRARSEHASDDTTTTSATPVVLPVSDWRAAYVDRRALRTMEGAASYYHDSLAGRSTASGEPYDPTEYTAANRTLPFGTVLRIVRIDTGRSVIVRVNDRGPFGRRRRLLDLSRAAAEELGMIERGVVRVRAEVLELGD